MNNLTIMQKLWQSGKLEERTNQWAIDLRNNLNKVVTEKRRARQWGDLRFYTSVSRIKSKGNLTISVRYYGHEVAELRLGKKVTVKILKEKAEKFGFRQEPLSTKAAGESRKRGSLKWALSPEARQLRKHFKRDNCNIKADYHSKEHLVESLMIQSMAQKSAGIKGYKPVLIGGLPFQMPVPFAASKGKAHLAHAKSKGNMDILARSLGRKLSVWELKRPHAITKDIVAQAYIYAISLIFMLNSRQGETWWRLMGFKKMPSRTIEMVVTVTKDKEKACVEQVKGLLAEGNLLTVDGFRIKPCLAVYEFDEKSCSVQIHSIKPIDISAM